jgi:hypothetical protein
MTLAPNGFQSVINPQPGVAKAGDFAGAGLRTVILGGGKVARLIAAPSPNQPYVGQFAWADQIGGLVYGTYTGSIAAKLGFIHNDDQAIIVPFLAGTESYIEAGQPVTPFSQGAFWANFPLGATAGQKVFANYATGSVYAAATGTTTTVAAITTGSIAATTGVLTVTTLASGTLVAGDVVTGANITTAGITNGVLITGQLTGTIAGGAGATYSTNYTGATAVSGGAMTAKNAVETPFYVDTPAYVPAVFAGYISAAGSLTVTSTASGTVTIGQTLALANGTASIPSNTQITAGSGPYTVTPAGNPIGSASAPVNFIGSLGTLAIISTWG